ncbi:MAG: universal stress protein [Myxococcales bacterium]|nr:universal stress protein [Myxococcales bacterium]
MRIQRILCPIDFSATSREAMSAAADLAKQLHASLTLFHVYQTPGYTLPDGAVFPSPTVLNDLFERIDRMLAAWKVDAERLGAARVDTATDQGIPWHEIVLRASEGDHDLIVIGTHGHTGLKHLFLGSVAERVVRRAPCPVLTIRASEHEAKKIAAAHAS